MPTIDCVYGLHFSELAHKFQEHLEFEGECLNDLIDFLENKYNGFKKELIDSSSGKLATFNQILIERKEEKTCPLFSLDADIREGDILTIF